VSSETEPQTKSERLYEAVLPFSTGENIVINPGRLLAASNPIVKKHRARFLEADLPDDEKERRRSEALWGSVNVQLLAAQAPLPELPPARKAGTKVAKVRRSYQVNDPALGGPKVISPGDRFSPDDPLVKARPDLFDDLIEER
jgi:hypothetical protein